MGENFKTTTLEPTRGLQKLQQELLIIDPSEFVQCDGPRTFSTRTCKVKGKVISDDWESDWTDILLDSGAAFSCVADKFLAKLPGKLDVIPTTRSSAVDASNHLITALGDCYLTIRVKSGKGAVELRRIRFAILPCLSVPILIGCEILAMLDFSLSQRTASINGWEIPRVLSILDDKPFQNMELKVIDAIIVEKDDNYITVVEAQIDRANFALCPEGDFIIHLLDDFTDSAVMSPRNKGRYTSMQLAQTDDQGELKARSILFGLSGRCSNLPIKMRALMSKIPSVSSTPKKLLAIQGTQKPSGLDQEMIDKMLFETALDVPTLKNLLTKFRDVFATSEEDLGEYIHPVELQLRDPSVTPKYSKPRIVPYAVRDWLDDKIKKMVDSGLIEVSKGSQFNSPVHIVKKKTPGDFRITVDYRYVNGLLKQNRWPLPHIKTVLEHLSGSKYFSVMDCRSGFWQLRLTENSKNITAFSCRGRQYEWKRLPMGLSVSPGLFQSVMMKIFATEVFNGVIIYVDDILCYSKTKEDHYRLLAKVFNKLRAAGVKLHPDKSVLGRAQVEYLGYEIGSFGYRPLKSKVEAILKMSRPSTKTELKSFIGSITFYTQSLPLLQYTLGPLHAISGSENKFIWGPEQEEAFSRAKNILSNCSPLAFPSEDLSAQLYLTTDASDIGYGGVLSELSENGTERPLGYFSGTFKGAEKNWIIREKELYSFFFGCNYFYGQLIGKPFTWRTDNRSLATLADASLKTKASGTPNHRVIRWLDYLSIFDFNTQHHNGSSGEMSLADCLSRLIETSENSKNVINLLKMPFWTTCGIPLVEFSIAQERDKNLMERAGPWFRYFGKKATSMTKIVDGIHQVKTPSGRWLPMIPQSLLESLFDYHHFPNHLPAGKMYNEIRNNFFVPGLSKKLQEYVGKCVKCQKVWAKNKPKFVKVKTTTAPHPWCWGAMDLIGPLPTTLNGNSYILTYVDLFTKWVELRSLPNKSAESVLKAVDSIFSVRGPPVNITSDNGREFKKRR